MASWMNLSGCRWEQGDVRVPVSRDFVRSGKGRCGPGAVSKGVGVALLGFGCGPMGSGRDVGISCHCPGCCKGALSFSVMSNVQEEEMKAVGCTRHCSSGGEVKGPRVANGRQGE